MILYVRLEVTIHHQMKLCALKKLMGLLPLNLLDLANPSITKKAKVSSLSSFFSPSPARFRQRWGFGVRVLRLLGGGCSTRQGRRGGAAGSGGGGDRLGQGGASARGDSAR